MASTVLTQSTANLPRNVSPPSTMPSAPSNTRLATSAESEQATEIFWVVVNTRLATSACASCCGLKACTLVLLCSCVVIVLAHSHGQIPACSTCHARGTRALAAFDGANQLTLTCCFCSCWAWCVHHGVNHTSHIDWLASKVALLHTSAPGAGVSNSL